MSIYLNGVLMLAAVLGGILVLARVMQAARGGGFTSARSGRMRGGPADTRRVAIEESVVVDGKRRLLLVRCEGQRILVMTGGPADLVIPVPAAAAEPGA